MMNKAFVKEPDETGQGRCPQCGSPGQAVGPRTLAAQLSSELAGRISESAWFCPYAKCPVAYFDMFERTIAADQTGRPIYPKDPDAPLCGCFGLTRHEIEEEVRRGSVARVRAFAARAKSPEARCELASPTGQCCLGEVQRYYFKFRDAWQAADSGRVDA